MPLVHAKKIVLIGDDKQLLPMIGREAIIGLSKEVGCDKEGLELGALCLGSCETVCLIR